MDVTIAENTKMHFTLIFLVKYKSFFTFENNLLHESIYIFR